LKNQIQKMLKELNENKQAELFQNILEINKINLINNGIVLEEIKNTNLSIQNNTIDILMGNLKRKILDEQNKFEQKRKMEDMKNELSLFQKIMIGVSISNFSAQLVNGIVKNKPEMFLNNPEHKDFLNTINNLNKINIDNEKNNGLNIPEKGNGLMNKSDGFMSKYKNNLDDNEKDNDKRDITNEKRAIEYHGGKWGGYSVVQTKDDKVKVYDDKGNNITDTEEGQKIIEKARIIWEGIKERNRENEENLKNITKMELKENTQDEYIDIEKNKNIEKNIEKQQTPSPQQFQQRR